MYTYILLEDYSVTHDQQFGFKREHSTDLCIFTVKSVTKYYTQENSPVFTCFLHPKRSTRLIIIPYFESYLIERHQSCWSEFCYFGTQNKLCV